MDGWNLHRMQQEIEGIALDANGHLVTFPAPGFEEIGRFYAVHVDGGYRTFVRADVGQKDELVRLDPRVAFEEPALATSILEREAPVEIEVGLSYVARRAPSEPDGVRILGPHDSTFETSALDPGLGAHSRILAVVENGRAISACVSIRENDRAAEAWVATDERHRRRGHAARVVAAWARDAIHRDRIAFYSHEVRNHASAGVARVLGFEHWMTRRVYA